jgi:hypothetical protein
VSESRVVCHTSTRLNGIFFLSSWDRLEGTSYYFSWPSCSALENWYEGRNELSKKKVLVWVPEFCCSVPKLCVCVCVCVFVCVCVSVCLCFCVCSPVPHLSPTTESEGCPLNHIGTRPGVMFGPWCPPPPPPPSHPPSLTGLSLQRQVAPCAFPFGNLMVLQCGLHKPQTNMSVIQSTFADSIQSRKLQSRELTGKSRVHSSNVNHSDFVSADSFQDRQKDRSGIPYPRVPRGLNGHYDT